jgi:Mlc titration factor MtfA (ptsG expression regulator)
VFDFIKRPHRQKLRATPLPEAWKEIVEKNVPLARRLTPEERARLDGLVQIFLDEKSFEGAGGLVLDDEIRVTIAAQACLLVVNREVEAPYPDLVSIVVYPHPWRTKRRERAGQVVLESEGANLGESWSRDLVVLAWDRARSDGRNPSDGHNVVLHEFAHQLDAEDGPVDGVPTLDRKHYGPWVQVLGAELDELRALLAAGKGSDLDAYGATNAPEFFAVVTEEFFEQPRQMADNHPELYRQLAEFFRQDPAERLGSASGERE